MNQPQSDSGNNEGQKQQGESPPQPEPVVTPSVDAIQALEAQEAAARDRATNEQNERKRQKLLERVAVWQAWFSGMLVLFTFVQAWFGGCQWIATRDQYNAMMAANEITDGQLQLLQEEWKPVLTIENVAINDLEAGKVPYVSMTIRNLGKKAATCTGAFFNCSIVEVPPGAGKAIVYSDHVIHGIEDFSLFQFSGNSSTPHEVRMLPKLTEDHIKSLAEKRSQIVFSAHFSYGASILGNTDELMLFCTYDFGSHRFDPHSMLLRHSSGREGEPNSGNMESTIYLKRPDDNGENASQPKK